MARCSQAVPWVEFVGSLGSRFVGTGIPDGHAASLVTPALIAQLGGGGGWGSPVSRVVRFGGGGWGSDRFLG